MGKASSSKKVARAAGTGGGRTSRGHKSWTYYGIILLVVLLGVVGTVTSRDHRLSQINAAGANTPPAVGATENAAYAVDVCGRLLPNIKTNKNPVGITTHGDGIIHIHPVKASAAGANTTLGLFASSIGMHLNASELQVPGGKLYVDGDKCNGSAGHVYVRHFAFPGDSKGVSETIDPQNIHLDDGSEYTIAFIPASQKDKIPPPAPAVVTNLTNLEAQAAAGSSSTTTAARTPSPLSPSTTLPPNSSPLRGTPSTTASPASPATTASPPTTAQK
ncbi:MAG TPA: hypothetical protein VG184_04005 [Acidimicrobiales bacterium]|jgi:hypothetical protein|nr:hypothetical protein [Acidimicrobiales bacterium]